MNQKQHKHLFAMCQCGKVKFEAVGPPILSGSCYCTSCQEAGRQIEQLASAPPVLDSDSGTGLILYRKDRVQCMMGQQYLEEHRLKPDSPTRRVIAKCCNSAMFRLHFPNKSEQNFIHVGDFFAHRITRTAPFIPLLHTSNIPLASSAMMIPKKGLGSSVRLLWRHRMRTISHWRPSCCLCQLDQKHSISVRSLNVRGCLNRC